MILLTISAAALLYPAVWPRQGSCTGAAGSNRIRTCRSAHPLFRSGAFPDTRAQAGVFINSEHFFSPWAFI